MLKGPTFGGQKNKNKAPFCYHKRRTHTPEPDWGPAQRD